MARRLRPILWCCLAAGGLLAILAYMLVPKPAPEAPRPPALAGQQVPATLHEIPFDRRYDLFCSFQGEGSTTFRGCKILGFTGDEGQGSSGRVVGSGAFSGISGSGSSSYSRRFFSHWLVLELADGRKAYIPPGAVKYIEEAAAEAD